MKRVGISVAAMAVGFAAVAGAAPRPTPTAVPVMKSPARMSVEELSKVKVPSNARLQVQRLSAKPAAVPSNVQAPDLVVLEPTLYGNPTFASTIGFPHFDFPGYVVHWWVKNQGNKASVGGVLKIECDVAGPAPGSPQYGYLKMRWCVAFHPTFPLPDLAAGATSGADQMWIGYPLFACSGADNPRPKITATVDPTNAVHETLSGEGNNVYVAEFCWGY